MKTELLALIENYGKALVYQTEGKISAFKDAKNLMSNIVFMLDKVEQEEAAIGAGGVERLRGAPAALTPAEYPPLPRPAWNAKTIRATEDAFTADQMRAHYDLGRAARAQAPSAKCETCNDNGLIGGPSFYDPGEGGVPCPDCSAPAAAEPVLGDLLPPIGSKVFIRHGRDDDAHACIVTGYYVWGDLGGDKRSNRVFVSMVYEGSDTKQARMLCDCYPTAEAALTGQAPTTQTDHADAVDAFTRDACKRLCEEVAEDETARGKHERANGALECAAQILMAHEIVRKHHRAAIAAQAAQGAKP